MNEQLNGLGTAELEAKGKRMNPLRRLQAYISRSPYAYLFYCFIIPVVINFLAYLAMEIHPFGDGSVLVLDLNAQYVYFNGAVKDMGFAVNYDLLAVRPVIRVNAHAEKETDESVTD